MIRRPSPFTYCFLAAARGEILLPVLLAPFFAALFVLLSCVLLRRSLPGGRGGVGDPDAMAQMAFTRHGFTLRPVADIVDQGVDAGFTVPEVRRPDGGSGSVVVVCERPASA